MFNPNQKRSKMRIGHFIGFLSFLFVFGQMFSQFVRFRFGSGLVYLWLHIDCVVKFKISKGCPTFTYQISPIYVMMGDSMRPTPSPSNAFAMKISVALEALYNINQAMTSGIFTINMALFRPNGSVWSEIWNKIVTINRWSLQPTQTMLCPNKNLNSVALRLDNTQSNDKCIDSVMWSFTCDKCWYNTSHWLNNIPNATCLEKKADDI